MVFKKTRIKIVALEGRAPLLYGTSRQPTDDGKKEDEKELNKIIMHECMKRTIENIFAWMHELEI